MCQHNKQYQSWSYENCFALNWGTNGCIKFDASLDNCVLLWAATMELIKS